jgi:hypothetical protein
MRSVFIALAALTIAVPARAGDFDKYLAEDTQFYFHMSMPKFFSSELVRTAVPMALDKYGDSIVGLLGMAKQFNPQAPDIPEDQAKQMIKQISDPKMIAQAFDVAKEFVTDLVVAGKADGAMPEFAIIVKSPVFTAEGAAMIADLVAGQPQVQLDKIKKDKGTIYAMTPANQPMKMFITVPAEGVLHICMSEKQAEDSFAPKGKPSDKLNQLIGKRAATDFIFVAGLGTDDSDYTSMAGSLVLDKDLSGKMTMTYKDEAKAAEQAKEANEKLVEMLDQLKDFLGDKATTLKPHLEKSKAVVDGKTVTSSMSIPGAAVQKMLTKDS